jgi:O-antigen ligase
MSDKSQRTEQATPHRLEKARREGQFSSSKELLSAAQFLAFTYLLSRWGAGWFERTGEETRRLLVHAFHAEMSFQQLAGLCRHTLVSSLTPLAVLGAALVALSLASQMAMTRMGFSFQRLAPDLKRLNPVSRLREMLRQNVWATAKALVLLPLAAWAVWTIARDNLADYAAFPLTDTRAGVSRLAGSLMGLMWKAAGLFLVLMAMMFTKVRAAGFAVLVSSSTLLFVSFIRGRISSGTFLKAVTAGLIIMVVTAPLVAHRFETGTWGEDRAPLMATAIQMIKDHWILGVGVNNYPFDILQYVPPRLRGTWSYTVHNEYLLRWSETGAIGFLIYYTLNVVLGLKLWRLTRSQDPWIFVVAAGLFSWLIGSIPHRIFSYYHYINWFLQFCVILALTYLASTLEAARLPAGLSKAVWRRDQS